ncbi:ribosome recycling factor family protein [Colwelliaceae bacterium 6471]
MNLLTEQTITLPSFLRRTMKAYALKAQIRALGCELHRIGRSRNWQLKASFEQLESIITFIEQQDEASWLWLSTHLSKQKQQLTHDALLHIAKQKSGITVNELMARTDCTLLAARKVIDEIEWLE